MAENIVFLGIKHCGKSTQGRLLAKRLQREFVDTDELLSSAYAVQYSAEVSAVSPREIMKKHGDDFFRRFEAGVIRDLIAEHSSGTVVALGGGVPCNAFLDADELKKLGVNVYLEVTAQTAFERIVADGIPPFLQDGDPWKAFQQMYEERLPYYSRIADLHISVKDEEPAELLSDFIYNELNKNGFL